MLVLKVHLDRTLFVLLAREGGGDALAAPRDVREDVAVFDLLDVGAREDGRGAIAIEFVDGQARALERYVRVIGVGRGERVPRLLEVEPRNQRRAAHRRVSIGARRRRGNESQAERGRREHGSSPPTPSIARSHRSRPSA